MRTERSTLYRLCGLGIGLFALAGCPGKLQDEARFLVDAGDLDAADATDATDANTEGGPTGEAGAGTDLGPCGDVPARIFVPSCGGTGCHGTTAPQQGLDLESPDVASRVVGVQAKVCTGTLADPTSPETSLMYTKLSTTPGCGAQMPLARAPLSSADAACVLAWITAQ